MTDSTRRCRICGCTDDACLSCIEKTGAPCFWIEDDLCSACLHEAYPHKSLMPIETHNTLYALLLLTLFSSGAGIRKLKIHGKSVFAIMANTDPDIDPERVNLRTLLENFALKVFPTKKGALGYCRRYAIQVTEKQDS